MLIYAGRRSRRPTEPRYLAPLIPTTTAVSHFCSSHSMHTHHFDSGLATFSACRVCVHSIHHHFRRSTASSHRSFDQHNITVAPSYILLHTPPVPTAYTLCHRIRLASCICCRGFDDLQLIDHPTECIQSHMSQASQKRPIPTFSASLGRPIRLHTGEPGLTSCGDIQSPAACMPTKHHPLSALGSSKLSQLI